MIGSKPSSGTVDEHLLQELFSGMVGATIGVLTRWSDIQVVRRAYRRAIDDPTSFDSDGWYRLLPIVKHVSKQEHQHHRLTLEPCETLVRHSFKALVVAFQPWMSPPDVKRELRRQIADDERWHLLGAMAERMGSADLFGETTDEATV